MDLLIDVKICLCCAGAADRGSSEKACRRLADTEEEQEKRGGSSATLQLLQGDAWAMKLALTLWSKT